MEVNGSDYSTSTTDYVLNGLWDKYGHPRTAPYVQGGPWPLVAIVTLYLLFVLKVGPAIMRHRKALELKTPMKLYNLVNVFFNALYFTLALFYSRLGADCWGCRDEPIPIHLVLAAGLGYMALKVFDLLDTVFFVFRKKHGQVTVLHVVHHSIMPFTAYFGIKFAPSTTTVLTPMLNTFVHTVMYYYYYLAASKPANGSLLTLKKTITMIQLIQFVIIVLQALHTLTWPSCGHPVLLSMLQLCEGVYFLIAFSRFYKKNYLDPKVDLEGKEKRQ